MVRCKQFTRGGACTVQTDGGSNIGVLRAEIYTPIGGGGSIPVLPQYRVSYHMDGMQEPIGRRQLRDQYFRAIAEAIQDILDTAYGLTNIQFGMILEKDTTTNKVHQTVSFIGHRGGIGGGAQHYAEINGTFDDLSKYAFITTYHSGASRNTYQSGIWNPRADRFYSSRQEPKLEFKRVSHRRDAKKQITKLQEQMQYLQNGINFS